MAEPWQERTSLLVGEETLERFTRARVAVVGLGGVGAYAAEMLVRAGIGHLTILDSDTVSPSNKNRQLLASESTIGRPKTEVMRERLLDINPKLDLTVLEVYLTPENIAEVFPPTQAPDFLVDAIDTLAPKLALIKHCMTSSIPMVSSMGSGAKYDITKVRITDISKSYNCPLAHMVRKRLHKDGIRKGFKVVFSEELPLRDAIIPEEGRNKKSNVGTISYMPAVFGCACAQAAVSFLMENK